MRLAFFGDVVGKSGRDGLSDHLPALKRDLKLDFVVINAENAAGGFGITENTARELFMAGADVPDPGQPQLGPARGPDLYRARAAADPPAQLSAPDGRSRRRRQSYSKPRRLARRVLVMNVLGRIHHGSDG
jgi:2',3'-cyclic-nucleotide 2'-phosphodiesterase